jgi:probable HAF family extracellular repeat protein
MPKTPLTRFSVPFPALLCLAAAQAAEPAPTFRALGDLPGGNQRSVARGASASGTFVVGSSASEEATSEAFRWSLTSGMTALGDLGNSVRSSGLADISADGLIAAGFGTLSTGNLRAVRWNAGGGMTNLGTLGSSGFVNSDATGIASSGNRIVGRSTSSTGFRAFLWISGSGMQNLGVLRPFASQSFSGAEAISGDGTTVVGFSNFTVTEPGPTPEDDPVVVDQGREAFVWTQGAGMVGLGDLDGGGLGSEGLGVSADGSVIVGSGSVGGGQVGVIWSDDGMQAVGDVPGGDLSSRLRDVSADGRFAVGEGDDDDGRTAVIWDADNGLRKLSDVLAANGVDFGGRVLRSVVAISDDGNVLVGNGFRPESGTEAWVITDAESLFDFVPPPPPSVSALQQSIRVTPGRGVKFTAQPGDIHQLQGRSDFEDEWQSFGDTFSSVGADGPTEFILPVGFPDPGFQFFRINRLPGSENETPFATGASLVDGSIVRFTSEPDSAYQVQVSPDLESWSNLGPEFDTDGNFGNLDRAVVDPFDTSDGLADEPRRFYRVERSR